MFLFLLIIFLQTFNSIAIDKISSDFNDVLSYVKKYLPDNPTILEAGAWDGSTTILMPKIWPKAKIYCFEPVPQHFEKLIKTVVNYNNIKVFPLALADFNGVSQFFVSEYQNQPNHPTGSSSLLAPKEHLTYDHSVIFPKKIAVETCTLDQWSIDNNVKNIDFMWLDMQGYELPALKNSLSLLSNVKVIYIELLFVEAYKNQSIYPEIRKWLEDKGFIMVACDFDEAHALKGSAIKYGEPYFGNGIFINERYF